MNLFGSGKSRCGILINTIVSEDFGGAFYENYKINTKSITFITIPCCVFATLRIITFPLRKMQFGEVQKHKRQILIDTVVYEDFGSPLRRNVKF